MKLGSGKCQISARQWFESVQQILDTNDHNLISEE